MADQTDNTVVHDDVQVHEEMPVAEESVSSSVTDVGSQQKKRGVLRGIKKGVKNVVNTISALGHRASDSHVAYNNDNGQDAAAASTTSEQKEPAAHTDVKEYAKNARLLRKKAEKLLKKNNEEFEAAERAQAKARALAENANLKTAKALEHQEYGQKLLAEAGAQLIEAGAMLQREAGAVQHTVPYNVHQEGLVRETTIVSSTGQQAAAEAHKTVTVRELEHTCAN